MSYLDRIKKLNKDFAMPNDNFAHDKIHVCKHCPYLERIRWFDESSECNSVEYGQEICFGQCPMTDSGDWFKNQTGLPPFIMGAGFKAPPECPMLPEFEGSNE